MRRARPFEWTRWDSAAAVALVVVTGGSVILVDVTGVSSGALAGVAAVLIVSGGAMAATSVLVRRASAARLEGVRDVEERNLLKEAVEHSAHSAEAVALLLTSVGALIPLLREWQPSEHLGLVVAAAALGVIALSPAAYSLLATGYLVEKARKRPGSS
jgi:hypothetical protein